MFKCNKCGKTTQPREGMNKIMLNRREKQYYTATFRHKKNNNKMIKYVKPYDEELEKLKRDNWELISEKQTKGWEIVSELNLCEECNRQNIEKIKTEETIKT